MPLPYLYDTLLISPSFRASIAQLTTNNECKSLICIRNLQFVVFIFFCISLFIHSTSWRWILLKLTALEVPIGQFTKPPCQYPGISIIKNNKKKKTKQHKTKRKQQPAFIYGSQITLSHGICAPTHRQTLPCFIYLRLVLCLEMLVFFIHTYIHLFHSIHPHLYPMCVTVFVWHLLNISIAYVFSS